MSASPSPRSRTLTLIVVILALALAVLAERARWFGRLRAAAAPEVVWIWSGPPTRAARPESFYAVGEVELERVPAEATLVVLADPEYLLTINGRWIGSGRYAAGGALDRYRVAPALVAGRNRILLELRSAAGAGGVALRLEDGSGRLLFASGPDWQIHRSARSAGILGEVAAAGAPAHVLGASPLGRWGIPPAGEVRALPRRGGAAPRLPVAFRHSGEDEWRRTGQRPGRALAAAAHLQLDFGREIAGYLTIAARDLAADDRALLRFTSEPPAGIDWVPDQVLLPIADAGVWRDSEPRRFRYVEIVGLEARVRVEVLPAAVRDGAASGRPRPGLLGIASAPPRPPVVDELWRALYERGNSAGTGVSAVPRIDD
jgi:hypothetical protein